METMKDTNRERDMEELDQALQEKAREFTDELLQSPEKRAKFMETLEQQERELEAWLRAHGVDPDAEIPEPTPEEQKQVQDRTFHWMLNNGRTPEFVRSHTPWELIEDAKPVVPREGLPEIRRAVFQAKNHELKKALHTVLMLTDVSQPEKGADSIGTLDRPDGYFSYILGGAPMPVSLARSVLKRGAANNTENLGLACHLAVRRLEGLNATAFSNSIRQATITAVEALDDRPELALHYLLHLVPYLDQETLWLARLGLESYEAAHLKNPPDALPVVKRLLDLYTGFSEFAKNRGFSIDLAELLFD